MEKKCDLIFDVPMSFRYVVDVSLHFHDVGSYNIVFFSCERQADFLNLSVRTRDLIYFTTGLQTVIYYSTNHD